ncbi:15048_t:CDS:2 [Funneliformis geosporum]|nr:15048_t:CDS:2 [Funneliformis geosporum]
MTLHSSWLNSSNILIHRGVIKIANFGFAKRIEAPTYGTYASKNFGLIPYVDPKRFDGRKRGESKFQDVKRRQDEIYLGIKALQGLRESIFPGTPEDYVKIYTECWDHEPDNRPTMNKVVIELNAIIGKTYARLLSPEFQMY